ncbi:MAG: class I adenylate-forming enzyme family protein [Melioribacteraceae bacterium]|nr:class I adenylate-forming enzyme family protein [Melioribacteraceae bacterium]
MFNNKFDWIAKWAKYTPNRLMLREHETNLEWTYSSFNKSVNAFASHLRSELKITKGDRVAVYSKNRSEYVLFFFACVKIGAMLVPLNFRLTPRELDILLNDADPKIIYIRKRFYRRSNQTKYTEGNSIKRAC